MRQLIYELRCKCGKYFLYCLKRGRDFRCDTCRNVNNMTVEDVENELSNMPKEEYESFMQDIKEWEEEQIKEKICQQTIKRNT